MFKFPQRLPVAFGLAFDVTKSTSTESGFLPAATDLGAKKELFGDVRLRGFAALLRCDFAERLVIVGGKEGRYKDENIARGWAIQEMLIKDYGIRSERLRFLVSDSNTLGNVQLISQHAVRSAADPVIVSNHYHLVRASADFYERSVRVRLLSAEAFMMLENPDCKQWLVDRFGSGPYAERTVEEIQGMAHKLQGTFKSLTKN